MQYSVPLDQLPSMCQPASLGAVCGSIHFDDLQFECGYRFRHAYFQAKLANLLFAYELQRRLAGAGAATISLAAHPGNARTEFGRDITVAVRAAMSPRVRLLTSWGPRRVESIPASHDAGTQRRLWEESERLTGITYRIGATQPHTAG